MGSSIYVIMFIAAVVYTLIIVLGVVTAAKKSKKSSVLYALHGFIEELKDKVHKEEIMDKGNYKNTRNSEYTPKEGVISIDGLTSHYYQPAVEDNGLSLSHLLNQKPTEENYNEIIELLIKLAKDTFNDYKFLIAKSKDEAKDSNFLQLVSHYSEAPELHREIFIKSVDYGVDMGELVKKFAARVEQGDVLPLGEDVVVITDDGSGQLSTGVSPINSGLEGGEIAFIVSFIKKENLEAFNAEHFPKENPESPHE